MAYQVLARKYRSRTFDEVVGQEPIATTLKNAVAAGRVHHGYLFTGTRGVGKTSMARILAKALNCLNAEAPTATPCLECEACRLIAEGQDLDVVEIDAASNTGVDNIRELRSNAAFRPARCRFKVYIIDEVHMLSTGAFNALLKTLEEPPPHVKFILATTEIQKVPATIQSRCQRFVFRNIDTEAISSALADVCRAENMQADDDVLRRLARLANGSMRDALSILDQLLSVGGGRLTLDVLDQLLPPAQNQQMLSLLRNVSAGDVAQVLRGLDQIVAGGRGLEVFCSELVEVLRTLMLIRAGGIEAAREEVPGGAADEYSALASAFELSHYVQMIAALEELRRNVRYSGAGRALAEITLIRFAKLRAWAPIEQLVEQLSGAGRAVSDPVLIAEKKKPQRDDPRTLTPPRAASASVASADRQPAPASTRSRPHPPVAESPALEETPLYCADENQGVAAQSETPRSAENIEMLPREADRTAVASSLSDTERRQIESDPVVRRLVELFDAVPLNYERRQVAPVPEPDAGAGEG